MKKEPDIFRSFHSIKDPNKEAIGAAMLYDVIEELKVVKGAMILEGYKPEDSCIKYMEDTIDNFKSKYRELNNFLV
jgi:hypothetical protein